MSHTHPDHLGFDASHRQRESESEPTGLTVTSTAVSSEPITADEAMQWLRINTVQLELLDTINAAVRGEVEDITRRLLTQRSVTAEWDRFYRKVDLPRPPVDSVSTVEYYDRDTDTWETVSEYDTRGRHLELENGAHGQPVRVDYTAGYQDLPPTLKVQMLKDIRHAYDHRDPADGQMVQDRSVYQQWRPY